MTTPSPKMHRSSTLNSSVTGAGGLAAAAGVAVAGQQTAAQSLLNERDLQDDKELNAFLTLTSIEDKAIAMALERERVQTETRLAEIERTNNFYIDEAHIHESNMAEAQFLVDEQALEKRMQAVRQSQEAADLKEEEEDKTMLDKLILDFRALKFRVRAREEAQEKVKSMKRRTQEKRRSFASRIKDIESRQERERRALMDSHARVTRNLTIYRKLLIETNPSLARIIATSKDKDAKTAAVIGNKSGSALAITDGTAAGATPTSTAVTVVAPAGPGGNAAPAASGDSISKDADRLHEAKMMQLKVRQQKEVEQMREEHLLRVKHSNKLFELELDQAEEWESMQADQRVQELEMEAEHVKEIETEQFNLQQQLSSLKAYNVRRLQQHKASELLHMQKAEAKQLTKQFKLAAKYRKKAFYEREEALKSFNAAEAGKEDGSDAGSDSDGDTGSDGTGSEGHSSDGGISKQTSEAFTSETSGSDVSGVSNATTDLMIEAQRAEEEETAKGRQAIEQLMLRQREMRESLQQQHREQRDSIKVDQRQAMSDIHAEQEREYQALKRQQAIEMDHLMSLQKSVDDMEKDNKVSNDILSSMLPKFVSEALKLGKEVRPRDFNNITVLCTDIVQFTNLTSRSTSRQIVSLLNRMYTAFDTILDDYQDVYKMETIGDAYILVGGLNTSNTSDEKPGSLTQRQHAVEITECAFRFLKVVEELDMSDQVQDSVQIRIGMHSGSAVGGVAGIVMPRFALFGETPNIAGQMEQKSQPNRIHVSPATYELIKKDYDLDARPEPVTLEGGSNMSTYWLKGKKAAATASAKSNRRAGMGRTTSSSASSNRKSVRMAE
ncbi:hypothetical protein H9P43_007348 [Blastocladiella emersonii ATCC 22665]|nr:hypothetical protein H9P43_007348 [Blastocladiella emersonii ATCC 22665]